MSRTTIKDLRARGLVWHYTTLEVLQLILASNTLLATEVRYQNDQREPETAREAIKEGLRKLSKDPAYSNFAHRTLRWDQLEREHHGFDRGRSGALLASSRFIFCASTDPDNLYAWRTYSGGSQTGCAIGIDPDAPLGVIGKKSEERAVSFAQWSDVIYNRRRLLEFSVAKLKAVGDLWNGENLRSIEEVSEQEKEGASGSNMLYPDYELSVLLQEYPEAVAEITAVAKHGSFRDEHETRITLSGVASGVTFTPGSHGPRPRVRLASTKQWGQVRKEPSDRLPIRAIVLAPNARPEAETTVDWLLHGHGYPIDAEAVVDEDGPTPLLYFNGAHTIDTFRSKHPFQDV